MNTIAIFASGAGSNAESIIRYFQASSLARVGLVLCNRSGAGVIERAERLGVDTLIFDREALYQADTVERALLEHQVDLIVLAGFLWLFPTSLINRYRGHILNIHPALLPRHGGKGMYGMNVHRAVVEAGDTQSGITIHQVNEIYDSGAVVAQFAVDLEPSDTPEQVAERVAELELRHFPAVIEQVLSSLGADPQ